MVTSGDDSRDDFFGYVPEKVDLTSLSVDLRLKIATTMSAAMKDFAERQAKKRLPGDRYEVAARMSRIYGREVSKTMLDAYAAASKDTHVPNYAFAIAFDAATESRALLELHASLLGCTVLSGNDTVLAQLISVRNKQEALRKQERALKKILDRSPR